MHLPLEPRYEPLIENAVFINGPHVATEIPGPKSRAMVAAEARNLAPGMQSISTLSGIAVARA